AVILLKSQQLRLRNGQTLNLQAGMSLTASIKLRKVTYLQLLLGGLRDKAQSLSEI
ncbi:MAG: hemolysin D, partial [Cyanobacteriota bacterium]|nr:hemolysin D [Cyanobacteriota bacterium]